VIVGGNQKRNQSNKKKPKLIGGDNQDAPGDNTKERTARVAPPKRRGRGTILGGDNGSLEDRVRKTTLGGS
jgi:hypothetical protein